MRNFRHRPLALGLLVTFACVTLWLIADPTYPSWWLTYNVAPAQPPAVSDTGNYTAWMHDNYAPATLGQLKYVATQTQAYLNDKFASIGGAGPDIANVIANFTVSDPNNFEVVNLGQLKYVAKPFYDRLAAVGFNTTADINYRLSGNVNSTVWTQSVPWNPSTNTTINYGPATLGQLKFVFAFDLDAGSVGNFTPAGNLSHNPSDIPDAWLVSYHLDPFDPFVDQEDPAGDGSTTDQAYTGNFSPINPASAPTPGSGVVLAPTRLNVSPLSYNVSTGVPVYDGNGMYLAWNASGTANVTYEITRQVKALDETPAETPAVLVSNLTSPSYNDTSVSTSYQYRYWVRAKQGSTYSAYSSPAPNHGWMHPLPPASTSGLDLANDPRVAPYADPDNDGLSNYEEFLEGTDPSNPDSDGDGIPDGQDSVPLDPAFSFPRPDTPHFAFIDLGPGTAIDINSEGDVLYQYDSYSDDFDTYPIDALWSGGTAYDLPTTTAESYPVIWTTLANNGTVMGYSLDTDGVQFPVVWSIGDGDYAITPDLGDAWLSTAGQIVPSRSGDIFFPIQYSNGDGTASYVIEDWTPDGDLVDVSDTYTNDFTVTNEIFDADGENFTLAAVGSDTLAYKVSQIAFGEFGDLYFDGQYLLDGVALPDSMPPDLASHPPEDLIGNLTHPFVINGITDASSETLNYLNGGLAARDFPANPHANAHLLTLNSLGFGLTNDSANPLWYGGRSHSLSELGCVSGNESVTFTAMASASAVAAGNTTAGNIIVGGPVYIDPVQYHHGTLPTYYNYFSNLPVDNAWVVNPAVILTVPSGGNVSNYTATLTANADSGFLSSIGGANNLYWDVNDDSGDPGNVTWAIVGNHTGTVSFSGNQTGTTVHVYGTSQGRVRFTLKYKKGAGTPVDLAQFSGNSALTASHLKYEAYVGPLLNLTCRIQRLYYYDGSWEKAGPLLLDSTLAASVVVANGYLRQAGIQLVLDTDTTTPNQISDVANISESSTTGIFYCNISNITDSNGAFNIRNNYYYLGNNTAIPKNSISTNSLELFLANNHRPDVLQIAVVGVSGGDLLGGKPNANGATPFDKAADAASSFATTDFLDGRLTSQLDYIVSLNDVGDLSDNHNLWVSATTGYNSGDGANHDGLYGLALYVGMPAMTDRNHIGQVLAHEVGHALSLRHRLGNVSDFSDELDIQKNSAGSPLTGGVKGRNLMDGPDLYDIPEDLDVHQVLIMRNHVSGSPALLQPAY